MRAAVPLVLQLSTSLIALSFRLQTSRDERAASNTSPNSQPSGTPTPVPSPVGEAPLGRALMEAAIQQSAVTALTPPMVVTPPGYWCDGTEHRHNLDSAGRALLPAQPAWQPRIDQDDTAKCYRRFFVGRVSGNSSSSHRVLGPFPPSPPHPTRSPGPRRSPIP
jgi:hypothetical protein